MSITTDESDHSKGVGRVAYSAQEAAQRLGLSEASIWRAIKRGQFRVVRIGNRTLIAAHQIDNLFDAAA